MRATYATSVLACLSAIGLVGCASTRQFVPKPNPTNVTDATVHVELNRRLGFGGWANGFKVTDDGMHIGDLGPNGTLLWERSSGPMHLVIGPKIMNMGDFSPVNDNLQGARKYSFTVDWPAVYPLSRNCVKRTATAALPVTEQRYASTPEPSPPEAMPEPAGDGHSSGTAPAQPILRRWALVIGISKYRDSEVPRLEFASADATAFHQWLVSPTGGAYEPAHVKLLCDEQATGTAIRDALFNWLKQPIEEDLVTIYYAGHGSPESPDNLKNLFLLPYDVDYSRIGSTGFPMWDIETSLKRFIRAKRVVIIADACHAAGVGQQFDIARRAGRGMKVNPVGKGFSDLSSVGDSVCVLSAADASQYSQEGERWGGGHGVFTHYLLQGLDGKGDTNGDGTVTVGELIPYVSEQVRRATGSAQCPRTAGSFDPALTIGK